MASPLEQPSLPWRIGSALVMGVVGSITRVVLFGANRTEVHGLEEFLELLDGKRNIEGRQRGLVTSKLSHSKALGLGVNFARPSFQSC
jgi:monolysocardiolipin acyltransferase